MEPIKVALAGIGNCASSFVQGLAYYKQHTGSEATGLLHDVLAGMRVKNIAIVAAFDVDDRKVGKDLADAIFSAPNVARRVIDLGKTGVTVMSFCACPGSSPRSKSSAGFTGHHTFFREYLERQIMGI